MDSQKAENLLNLALDSTEEEREKSLDLQVGYEPEERTWELIIKYDQSKGAQRPELAEVIPLSFGFGKPERPSNCRSVEKRDWRPVRALWT